MISASPLKTEIINKVASEFARATNLAIVVTNIHGKEASECFNFTPFCRMMRNNPKYQSICQRCDQCGGLEASKQNKPSIYRCHAGLTDFSIPLVAEDHLFGFLLCGQVRVQDRTDIPLIQQEQSFWQYDHHFTDYYSQVPVVDYEKVTSSADLLQIIVDHYLTRHLSDVASIYKEQNMARPAMDNNDRNNVKMKKALKYIESHLADEIRLEEVAEQVYLSPYYFSKFFKKQQGIGFNAYLTQQRMKQAKKMLENSDISIAFIAKNLGFSQTSYFCKVFRQSYQVTPQEHRSNYRGSKNN